MAADRPAEPWCRLCGEPIAPGDTVVWSMLDLTRRDGRGYTAYRPACTTCTEPLHPSVPCEADCGRHVVHTQPRAFHTCSWPCDKAVRHHQPPAPPPPPRPCAQCGEMIPNPGTNKRRFCTAKCRSEASRIAQVTRAAAVLRDCGIQLPEDLDLAGTTLGELLDAAVRAIARTGLPKRTPTDVGDPLARDRTYRDSKRNVNTGAS